MTTTNARRILREIAHLFSTPERLVGTMAATMLTGHGRPIDRWSWTNRMICWLHGTSDARTFLQWKDAGRSVLKGTSAFHILAPCTTRVREETDEGNEETREILTGFRAIPVFAVEHTEGESLPSVEPATIPPLHNVASAWQLTVSWETGPAPYLGSYSPKRQTITLVTDEQAVFFHELVHAADDRLHGLQPGQLPDQETVAELGAAVLARLYGSRIDRKAWEYIRRYHANPADAVQRLLPRIERCLTSIMAHTHAGATSLSS